MTTISLISPIINIQMMIQDSSKANKNVKSDPIKKDEPHNMGQSNMKSDPIKKDQSNMKSDPIKKDEPHHMGQSKKNEIEHKNLFGGEIKHKEFMIKM